MKNFSATLKIISNNSGVMLNIMVMSYFSLLCNLQWYLLKDMLETHACSSLLLPESISDAWIAASITQEEVVSFGEKFLSRQFECSSKWRHHITPHWRLKGFPHIFQLMYTHIKKYNNLLSQTDM